MSAVIPNRSPHTARSADADVDDDALHVVGQFKQEHEPSVAAPIDPRTLRLSFSPLYSFVGLLFTDRKLLAAVWRKCRNGTIRGLLVGGGWLAVSWRPQLAFIRAFGNYIPRVSRLQGEHVYFGYNIPVATYATVFFLSAQFYYVLRFFLSKNIRIARARAWALTVESRGKPAEFWGPYVEEWQSPPIDKARRMKKRMQLTRYALGWAGRFVFHKFILFPLNFIPVVGLLISSAVKALGTARYLHQPYYESKRMTPEQIDVFIEERKWDYLAFGFTSALLESLPFVGMLASVSNRVGAAMWAFDLEKRQAAFRSGQLQPRPRTQTSVDLLPAAEKLGLGGLGRVDVKSDAVRERVDVQDLVGGWREKKDL